jgi:hypothetical protein
MSFIEIETNELMARACHEVLRAKKARERVAVTIITQEFRVDY